MNITDLLHKGLIKKQGVEQEEIKGSIEISARFLDRAKGNLEMNFYDVAFLLAYNSMFHAVRSLLFKQGYKERGHFALIAALKELYKNDTQLTGYLEVLDNYRLTRHAIQYSGELSNELNAIQSIKDAEKILRLVKKKLKPQNPPK
jgi:uncharacterized protein (UPF0332 family)